MTEPTPPALRRRDAIARGYTDAEIRTLCRNGGLRRLRPGTYLSSAAHSGLEPSQRHRELIRATLPGVAAGAVASHQSAAVLHGFSLWDLPLDRVHVTRDRAGGGRRTRHLHVHCAPLGDGDVGVLDGIRLTSAARTIADLCRTAPFEAAVVVGDSALHATTLQADAVAQALTYAAGRPGHPAAMRALGFLDGRSERSASHAVVPRWPRPGYRHPNCRRHCSIRRACWSDGSTSCSGMRVWSASSTDE